jgi:hypothetical protein
MLKNGILLFDTSEAHPEKSRSPSVIVWVSTAREGATIICYPIEFSTGAWHRGQSLPAAAFVRRSEVSMEPKSQYRDGAESLVIAGIVNVLKVEGSEEAAPEVRGIEPLNDFFGAVSEVAIAK